MGTTKGAGRCGSWARLVPGVALAGLAALVAGCAGTGPSSSLTGPSAATSPVTAENAGGASPSGTAVPAAKARSRSLADVRTWAVSVRSKARIEEDVASWAALPADLLIVAPAPGAAGGSGLTAAQIDQLKAGQGKSVRRLLLMLDAGALRRKPGEKQPTPPLGPDAVLSLVKAGFDGVCWTHPDADLADPIVALAQSVRKERPSLVMVCWGGETLPSTLPEARRAAWLAAIDGVVTSDTFFSGPRTTDNDLNQQTEKLNGLDGYRKAGKTIFALEHLQDKAKVDDFVKRAAAHRFVPLASPAPLDPGAAPPSS